MTPNQTTRNSSNTAHTPTPAHMYDPSRSSSPLHPTTSSLLRGGVYRVETRQYVRPYIVRGLPPPPPPPPPPSEVGRVPLDV